MPPTFRNIPILCFHDIATPGGISLARFCSHLDTIRAMGFQTISAQKLLSTCLRERPLSGKPILLTFDDCHVSNWIHAIPELEQRGMRGIFFAVTDFIVPGPVRTVQTVPQLKSATDSFTQALTQNDFSQFMTREEIISTVADHGMEVYSHTSRHEGCFRSLTPKATVGTGHWSAHGIYDHPADHMPTYERGSAYAYNGFWPDTSDTPPMSLRQRSDQERFDFCIQDFSRSLGIIKTINQVEKQLICWPWGEFDDLAIRAAQETGFAGAFNLDRFVNGPGTDPFRFHRIPVSHRKSVRWLKSRLLMHASRPGAMIFSKFFRIKS